MKTRMLILCLFAVAAAAAEGIDFDVDRAVFRGPGDSSRVEFFYAIPMFSQGKLQLRFQEEGSELVARFTVRFEMEGGRGFRQDATLAKRASMPAAKDGQGQPLVEAREAGRTFVDGFSVPVPPGRYRYRVTVGQPEPGQSGDSISLVEIGSLEDSLEVPDFSNGLQISSLQLAAGITYDSITGGSSVIPNPTRTYGEQGVDRVFFYFEGYGLSPEGDSYEYRPVVITEGSDPPDTVIDPGPQSGRKRGAKFGTALGLSVAGLKPGDYRLGVELADRPSGQSVFRDVRFRVAGEDEAAQPSPYRLEMTELERKYHDRLDYIATRRERDYYNSLGDSGKVAYLAAFWQSHNLAEFARRMETAAGRFKTSRTPGLETDRGRIYVKYGEPDEVERVTIEVDRRPREYWHYYGTGYAFIFIDVRGDNDYRLAWTNSPDEPGTGYEGWLTADEKETFGIE